jgi:hypothetical protein
MASRRCELRTSHVSHDDGDDALRLVCDREVIDRFGRVGEDPGTACEAAT